ncbi:TMEM175 family protein [Lactobacillus selangorensis]|nr:TMEM175 family protein [Lactobacillus selangorensis]
MNKGRLEAYTDAIVAIVVTILVLDFKAPDRPDIRLVWADWKSFLVYIVSFILIFSTWLDHQLLFRLSERLTRGVFWANALWLFFLSLIPYVTSFSGKFPNYGWASVLYTAVLFCWTISYILLARELAHANPDQAALINKVGFRQPRDFAIYEGSLLVTLVLGYFIPWLIWFVLIGLSGWTILFNRGLQPVDKLK